MAKRITCTCGFVVNGQNDQELLANARAHIVDAHPDLVGQATDDDLLAMAQEI